MTVDTENGGEAEATDLRSMLAAAADEVERPGREETPAAHETGETASREETLPADGKRARGPDGKFVPKEGDAGAESPAPKTDKLPERTERAAETAEQPKPEQPGAPPVDAPVHWSAADKEKFAGLPAGAHAPFLDLYKRMEAGFTPKLQRGAQLERDYGAVVDIFAPHAETLRTRGQVPADVIKSWASVETGLLNARVAQERGQQDTNGATIIANLIRGYKIDPGAVARALQGAAAAPTGGTGQPGHEQRPAATPVDPVLQERLTRLEQAETQRTQQINQERLTGAQRQIETFANEKDGDGNLKHPFFADVEADMNQFARADVGAGKTVDLDDLYDRAVYANRETRAKLLDLLRETEAKRAAAERKAKSGAAQKAGKSVTGAPGAGQANRPAPQNRSLREALEDAAANLETA